LQLLHPPVLTMQVHLTSFTANQLFITCFCVCVCVCVCCAVQAAELAAERLDRADSAELGQQRLHSPRVPFSSQLEARPQSRAHRRFGAEMKRRRGSDPGLVSVQHDRARTNVFDELYSQARSKAMKQEMEDALRLAAVKATKLRLNAKSVVIAASKPPSAERLYGSIQTAKEDAIKMGKRVRRACSAASLLPCCRVSHCCARVQRCFVWRCWASGPRPAHRARWMMCYSVLVLQTAHTQPGESFVGRGQCHQFRTMLPAAR
jgi:hypothetical protein